MKHKNLSWAQRERNGRLRLSRLRSALLWAKGAARNPINQAIARTQSEIRQRDASNEAKMRAF
jgi:hypothetical protein